MSARPVWSSLNGSMEASKPWTRATGAAATASRERASVPLPTEEVAVIVWLVQPAEAGVPESTPVDASRERPEGEGGETDQVTAWPDRSEKGGGGLADEELGAGRARDHGGLEDGDGERGRVGPVAGVGVDRVVRLGGGLGGGAADGAGGRVEGEARPGGRGGPRRYTTRS